MRHYFYLLFISLMPALLNATSTQRMMNEVKEKQIAFVDFMFTDLAGVLRSVTVPTHALADALEHGLKFDGSSIPHCSIINESDMHLVPDVRTFTIINGQDRYKSARIMCDIYRSPETPYEGDARYILKQVLQEAHDFGYEFFVGPELEFFLFNSGSMPLQPCDNAKYFQAEECSMRDEHIMELLEILSNNHIAYEKIHHEVAPGQREISIHYANALSIADQVVLTKHLIKRWARGHNLQATFMPKPLNGQNGSGMHVHFSLYDMQKKSNAFANSRAPEELSDIAHHFIAGVLYYAPELTAIFNASINSYKRLVPGHEAPIYRCWGKTNRSAMIRIPQFDMPSAARAELRSPDASSNIYLVFAGILKAGLQGIKQKMTIPVATEMNLYRISAQELNALGVTTLPTSLEGALKNFETSEFIESFMGNHALNEYVKAKKDELAVFRKTITNWEIERYW